MASSSEHFFNNPKIQQLVIQFACRIPVRRELSAGEKKALENVLKSLDPEVFQLFDEPLQKNPACLFQVLRQLPVEATTITMPSFVLSNDSFSFLYPIKMVDKTVLRIGSIDAGDINRKMLSWVTKVQEVINNPHCQRTGKIYELVLGRFSPSDKQLIFKELFSTDLKAIGELVLTFANYHISGGDVYNIQNNIRYLQNKLEDDFFLSLRIDINNRNLFTTMEPRDIEKVWNFADSIIDSHLKNILNII